METPARTPLSAANLPALLRPLLRGKATGVLRAYRAGITKVVYVSAGRLIFATSTDPDDRLGERLLMKGTITYRALEDSVQAIRAGKRQGTIFVENGAIRSRDLVTGVTEQVQDIVYGLFRWDDGEIEFEAGDLPSREVIVLRMSTGDLILEGVRRIEGWNRIRQAVGPLEQRYALSREATPLLAGLSLQKHELALVAALDGPASVEEICSALRQADYLTCRAILGLWAVGVLDRIPEDLDQPPTAPEKTEPHVERSRGASVSREIELFGELHRFLFDLVSFELRDRAAPFFGRALARAREDIPPLFEGVSIDGTGQLDAVQLRQNIVGHELASYRRGLDHLLEIEQEMARVALGERKAAIIADGILALERQQLDRDASR